MRGPSQGAAVESSFVKLPASDSPSEDSGTDQIEVVPVTATLENRSQRLPSSATYGLGSIEPCV